MSTIRRSIIAGALALPMSLGTIGVAAAADTTQEDAVAPNDGGVSISIQADSEGDDPEASGEGHASTDDDALLDLGDDGTLLDLGDDEHGNEHHEHDDEDGLLGILG